ncbi:pyruvate kinase [Anaerolineales bacterium HSG6]|nr:pyruvate kinase [Anaerolineales bacterium HSG6]MDM8532144.1 pyruvate kinase [Anaerolineales bacterium HSG25]
MKDFHAVYKKRPRKRTKIVATIGPACDNEETLRKMVYAGLNVVRINFSHANYEALDSIVDMIRKVSEDLNFPIAILGDLRGPRMRVGEVENGAIELKTGDKIKLTPEKIIGTADLISVTFKGLASNVWSGNTILLDDGNLKLIVEKIDDTGVIICRITRGGTLSSNRGINLPGVKVDLPSISAKDFADVDYAISKEFDFLALSFVQSANDVRLLNAYLAAKQAKIPVISKIEKKSALTDIKAIVEESYGIMVARGDLALEMSISDVPIAQKQIIAVCRQAAKPVITATQMLESMTHSHKPTRAEATDVANAVLDGTDALMLSGETAIGDYPVDVVETMSKIAGRTEYAWIDGELPPPPDLELSAGIAANVAQAGSKLVQSLDAKMVTTYTTSGATARRIASHRIPVPILAFSSSLQVHRQLALTWGIRTMPVEKRLKDVNTMFDLAMRTALESGLVEPRDILIMIGSARPYGIKGRTNSLRVERIPDDIIMPDKNF